MIHSIHQMMKKCFLFFTILFYSSCSSNEVFVEDEGASDTLPNILLVIADDMGKDATNGYDEGRIKPNTPNIDKIKNEGLQFNNFWVNPTCTSTRASIITGKYGHRTGVKQVGDELAGSETSLQQFISTETNNSYATAIVGKWHLAGNNSNFNPEVFGIDYYAGLISGDANDYYSWKLTEDGASTTSNEYATTKFTTLAIDWTSAQDKPWFLWLAYNAPHKPFHAPPANMHSQGVLTPFVDGNDPMPYYTASIEALDFQLGRLMESFTQDELDNTIIVFMGDNGTPGQVVQSPYTRRSTKGSLNQGGINVPLFISGKGVSRTGQDDNLVASTDLYATISELAGVKLKEMNDSKSFASLISSPSTIRKFQFSMVNDESEDHWVIRNTAYKLFSNESGVKQLYNIINDPYESSDLMTNALDEEAQDALEILEKELSDILN